ncbi:hypothetical protein KC336_g4195 [Hortaea werneckii]|nr:hypothetical protein KC336_g4195 [Hortaea werneckii]
MSTIVAVAASGRFLGTVPCPPSTTCGGSTVAAPPPVGMVGMAFVLVDLVGASTAFVAAAAEDGPEAAETAVEDQEAEEEEAGEDADDDAGDFAAGESAAGGLVLGQGVWLECGVQTLSSSPLGGPKATPSANVRRGR